MIKYRPLETVLGQRVRADKNKNKNKLWPWRNDKAVAYLQLVRITCLRKLIIIQLNSVYIARSLRSNSFILKNEYKFVKIKGTGHIFSALAELKIRQILLIISKKISVLYIQYYPCCIALSGLLN